MEVHVEIWLRVLRVQNRRRHWSGKGCIIGRRAEDSAFLLHSSILICLVKFLQRGLNNSQDHQISSSHVMGLLGKRMP